ncbi:hypothetical protein B0H11DRAFT_2065545 [Mycena galericulata]|nr:hypothetical protein B0H11DRAFT_2065545 [Mycena galericulata]
MARLLLEISSNIFLQACPSARRLLLIVIMIRIGNGAGRSSNKLSFVLCLQKFGSHVFLPNYSRCAFLTPRPNAKIS